MYCCSFYKREFRQIATAAGSKIVQSGKSKSKEICCGLWISLLFHSVIVVVMPSLCHLKQLLFFKVLGNNI